MALRETFAVVLFYIGTLSFLNIPQLGCCINNEEHGNEVVYSTQHKSISSSVISYEKSSEEHQFGERNKMNNMGKGFELVTENSKGKYNDMRTEDVKSKIGEGRTIGKGRTVRRNERNLDIHGSNLNIVPVGKMISGETLRLQNEKTNLLVKNNDSKEEKWNTQMYPYTSLKSHDESSELGDFYDEEKLRENYDHEDIGDGTNIIGDGKFDKKNSPDFNDLPDIYLNHRVRRKAEPDNKDHLHVHSEEGKQFIQTYGRLLDDLSDRSSVKYKISPFDYAHKSKKSIWLKFVPFKVLSLDERAQSVTIASYITIKWNDNSLRWNPSSYLNITKIHIQTSDVWTPTILLPRASGEGNVLRKPDYVSVKVNKRDNVKMSTLFKFTTSCGLDLSVFPFDTQTCSILFIDEHDRPITAINPDPEDSSDDLQEFKTSSGEWDIMNQTTAMHDKSSKDGLFRTIQYYVTIKRRSTFYVANLLIPLHTTSFVALLVFWIPPETGEKISFLVSIYVSMAMYLSVVNDVLPRSTATLPSFNLIIVCINIQIALAFMASLFVLRQYRQQKENPTDKGDDYKENDNLSYDMSHSRDVTVTKIKVNSIAPVDYLEEPEATRPEENKKNYQKVKAMRDRGWLDYKFLDKMFFVFFMAVFLAIMFTPWLLSAH